ncbi:ATP-binding protein [Streptomyces sp. MB09-02B]|uniref:ATP-binding protein n=1 Tax=Streptomyces sp. MB09-02B TaxID=3028667 RepID=UPI0029A142D1|nr:tetratricopeptide repeat protein [Streptomyces sp. MB09-02B]MDX3639701.1 tetratricopeptide repeat protein [Streptomyces sp. MB09-02B]
MTLAVSAGSMLVGAMLTDTWTAAKNRIVALWQRYQPDEAEAVAQALEQTQGRIIGTDEDSRAAYLSTAETQWQERLSVLFSAHPEAAGALLGLLQQAPSRQAACTVHGDQVINITGLGRADALQPRQLPGATRHFVGRISEIDSLSTLMAQAEGTGGMVVISAIDGTAGVGKTTLAVHWAHRVAHLYPDGQLYVNLRGFDPSGAPVRPADVIRGFLDAFGVDASRQPPSPEAQVGLYRSLLAGRQVLLVLDNARDTDHVRPILPGSATCMVIVTSRNQLTGLVASEGAHPLTLGLLTVDEAHQLLARRLGADRVARERDAVADIIERCARLPLALSIVAARTAQRAGMPLSAVSGQLKHARAVLDTLDTGDVMTDVRAVFSWSYGLLATEPARVFRLLGTHAGPDISAAATASLTAMPLNSTRRAMEHLARSHLVDERLPGRYTFHDLLRTYAMEQTETADTELQQTQARRRAADHYLHTAHSAALCLDPHRTPLTLAAPGHGVGPEPVNDYDAALAWYEAEHPVLLNTLAQASANGLETHAWQLAWSLTDFLDRRGHWHDQVTAQTLARAAAERLDDPLGRAWTSRNLAHACTRLGRYDDAFRHFQTSVNEFAALGADSLQAGVRLNYAWAYELTAQYDRALEQAEVALALYRALADEVGHARSLNAVGWYQTLSGDHEQALAHCEEALPRLRRLGVQHDEAYTLESIAHAHRGLGHLTQAADCYGAALELFRRLGDRYYEATIHIRLGEIDLSVNRPTAARDRWEQALRILDALHHQEADDLRARLEWL